MAKTRVVMTTILTPYERNSIMTINKHKDGWEEICPSNQKLVKDFLLYITISQYTYQTCVTMKTSLINFLIWNARENKNYTFYCITKNMFKRYLVDTVIGELGLSYDRARIIKSHLNCVSEYCEHILGTTKFNHVYGRGRNKWYNFKNVVKFVEIPTDVDKTIQPNKHTFNQEDLGRLDWYLKETRNYQAYVIFEFANMGADILNLTIEDIMERGSTTSKKWVRYLERYGLPFNEAIVVEEERNVWRPATKEDLLKFEEMFTAFLNKKFIICNDYRL